MTLCVFLLILGAVARVTRFLNSDVLAEPIRDAVTTKFGEDSKPATLIECPFCASIWIAAIITPLGYFLGHTPFFVIPAVLLTVSYIYAITASWVDPDR